LIQKKEQKLHSWLNCSSPTLNLTIKCTLINPLERKALRLASPQSDVNPSVWHSEQEERGESARRRPGGRVLNLCNWLQQQRERRAQEDAIKNLISLVKTLFISGESFYSDTGGLAQIYAHRRVSPREKLMS
jgi:hypothetical protein